MSLSLAPEGWAELRKAELAFFGEFHGIAPVDSERALDYGRFLIAIANDDPTHATTRLASGIIEVAIVADKLGASDIAEQGIATARAICNVTRRSKSGYATKKAAEALDTLKVATVSTILSGGDYYPETQTDVLDRVRLDMGKLAGRIHNIELRKKIIARRRNLLATGLLGLTTDNIYFFEPSPLLRNTISSLQSVVCDDQGRKVVTQSINVNGIGLPTNKDVEHSGTVFVKSRIYRVKTRQPVSMQPTANHISSICWEDYFSVDELRLLENRHMSPSYSAHLRGMNTVLSTKTSTTSDPLHSKRLGMLRPVIKSPATFSVL